VDDTKTEEGTLPEPARQRGERVEAGDRFGRFTVISTLGTGGVGVVFKAQDPELRRTVAIKLLHPTGAAPHEQAQMRRKAQAMAQLQHPNVVAIHEIGVEHGRLFIVMDYVEGCTLRSWLCAQERRGGDVLEMFVAVGRGLAAAHDAGLIHRDFRPENVLVGNDGHPRIVDFGLVPDVDNEATEHSADALSAAAKVDAVGESIRTSAYMSPEHFLCQPVDARSDQFSFCVSLHEALYGVHPFPDDTAEELRAAILEGRRRVLSKRTSAFKWVDSVLDRGLALAPEDRWPSMDRLLHALTHDPAATRRRVVASGLALAVVGGLGFLGATFTDVERSCATLAAESLRDAWSDERARGLATQLAGASLTYIRDLSTRVPPTLDRYAEAWTATRVESCEARRRGEVTAETYEQISTCLDWRRRELESTVLAIERAPPDTQMQAARVVSSLEAAHACLDAEIVAARYVSPSPEAVDEVEAIRETLIELRRLDNLGNNEDVEQALVELGGRVRATEHPPLIAEYRIRLGKTQLRLGKQDEGLANLRVVLRDSLRAGDDERAAAAAVAMMRPSTPEGVPDLSALKVYGGLTRSLHARSPAAKAGSSMTYYLQLGQHSMYVGDWKGGYDHYKASLAATRHNAPDLWLLEAKLLVDLAEIAALRGMSQESQQLSEEALELHRAREGLDNPRVASVYSALGTCALDRGDPLAARTLSETGLALLERADHGESAEAWGLRRQRAVALELLGDLEGALANLQQYQAYVESLSPGDAPTILSARNSVAVTLDSLGRYEEASALLLRAIEEASEIIDGHPVMGIARLSLADIYLHTGELDQARAEYRRARELLNGDGDLHPMVAYAIDGLGQVALKAGDYASAEESLSRALELREQLKVAPTELSGTRLALASAVWGGAQSDDERVQARELAARARADVEGAPASSGEREAAERWLAEHPDPHARSGI